MRVKVERRRYQSIEEFEADILLVFYNCFKFNGINDISMVRSLC